MAASESDEEREERDAVPSNKPTISHRFPHDNSILVLAVYSDTLYAGTQGGELLVYNLNTFERRHTLEAHDSSVLGLCLSPRGNILLSSAGDRFVNVWDTTEGSLTLIASLYSVYDIGDLFCVSWSPKLERIYLGAQNTSIQWFDLKSYKSNDPIFSESHPFLREDRFFDSPGPGGIRTPRKEIPNSGLKAVRLDKSLEIPRNNILPFAHNGYVYCMLLTSGSLAATRHDEILITGGGDGLVKIWCIEGHEAGRIHEIGRLGDQDGDGDPVLSIVLDGTFLYSGRVDGVINVWDLETRQLLRTLKPSEVDVLALSIGKGMLFACFVDGTVTSFDQRHESIDKWQAHRGRILASCFSDEEKRTALITGGNDNTIALWNTRGCYDTASTIGRTSQEQLLDSLLQFVAYRSVSSDPAYKSDCRRCASWLRALLKRLGASTEMLKTQDGHNPVVFARFAGTATASERKQRILFYGHYDVVPADDKQRTWHSDPFTLVGSDGYLYGRGATDNKGPIMAAIFAVAELLSSNKLRNDIVFLLEGEEESGSRGFKETVRQNKALIGSVDWVLLANSYWLDDQVPCLTYGLRGVLRATVEVSSDEPDLHSGVDGSSLLDEPMKDLVLLISKLTGPHGKVLIPGFDTSNPPVTEDEKALYHEVSQVLLKRNPDLETPEQLIASLMGRWRYPTLTVHGFKTSGPSNSSIIPCSASASLSMRLVPNQDVDQIVTALQIYLNKQFTTLESKNHLTITIEHTAEPWLGDYNNKLFKTIEKAVMEAWTDQDDRAPQRQPSTSSISRKGSKVTTDPPSPTASRDRRRSSTIPNKPTAPTSSALAAAATNTITSPTSPFGTANFSSAPSTPTKPATSSPTTQPKVLYIREGGSIPAIRFLEKEFNAPAAHFPAGQASDNAHLVDERIRVVNLYKAKEVFGKVFGRMGE